MSRFLKLNPFQKIFVEAKVQKYISHEMSKVSLHQVRADFSRVVFTKHYIDLTSSTSTTHNTLFFRDDKIAKVVLIVMKICH